jgi:glycosyltransferase involved in cell wall biosynthesis
MNLLINASNLHHGGGKTVALQLIDAIAPLRPRDELYVLSPGGSEYEALRRHPNVHLITVPKRFHKNWLAKLYHLHHIFPRLCKKFAIDKVLSLGNVAFPAGGRPQLVYIQLPQLVYHESPAWKLMDVGNFISNSLMDQYVAWHLRYATSYAVQTEVMQGRLRSRFDLPEEKSYLLPNAAIRDATRVHTPLGPIPPLRLLFLSRYYPHKNFECLPALAQIIEERSLPVEITLTISAREGQAAGKILNEVRRYPFIRNVGPKPLDQIAMLVEQHHGIFLPTFMESFSGAYAEALQHRRLIFTSHYDFATQLLDDAAFYFDPMKPEHMASVLESVIRNPELVDEMCGNIERRFQTFDEIDAVADRFNSIIDNFS